MGILKIIIKRLFDSIHIKVAALSSYNALSVSIMIETVLYVYLHLVSIIQYQFLCQLQPVHHSELRAVVIAGHFEQHNAERKKNQLLITD